MFDTDTRQDVQERIAAHRDSVKRLGHWTTAGGIEVRAHRGSVTLDLRSPRIADGGDIRITVDLDGSTLKLLLPDDAVIDDWDLKRAGRGGKVKDAEAPTAGAGRRIVLAGHMGNSEIRVNRGGIAVLAALFSREFLAEARTARKHGTHPSLPDPARTAA
ncbi:hypothetical protein AB0M28_04495 [Streptomyces sp. NPDC051940]|uniref:hypothetical protein n=1 Tax=Streptomyces sp. NPDC051940 TaxID=3155675 RepID=UPI0034466996